MRGQFVRVTSREGNVERGRIKKVYVKFRDIGAPPNWLIIQRVPFTRSELLEPWYSILIEPDGSMWQPQSRLEDIAPFKSANKNKQRNLIDTMYKADTKFAQMCGYQNAWSIVRAKWFLPWKIVNFWWKTTGEAQGNIEGRIGQRFLQEYDLDNITTSPFFSMNIFSDEDRSIFSDEVGWDSIFQQFEKLMQENCEHLLINLNDSNINVLLKASKETGLHRKCTLYRHALRHFDEIHD